MDYHVDMYYKLTDITTISRVNDIYLIINIPLTNYPEKLTLCKVITFPIPIHNTFHSSEIINLPKFIAYSSKQHQYITFKEKPEIIFHKIQQIDISFNKQDTTCINQLIIKLNKFIVAAK